MHDGKKYHIEILRIICIIFVVFNHTSPNGYMAFVGTENIFLYYLYMFASALCKIAVPVFFMISGALLLGKEEPIYILLKKRVLRMAVILLAISVPYYLWLSTDRSIGVVSFLETIYTQPASTALWYLYSYIGFLLMLPLLRKMVKSMSTMDYGYLFLVNIIFNFVILIVEGVFFKDKQISSHFSISIITQNNIFYPLIGYYIENLMDKKYYTHKNQALSVLFSVVSIGLICLIVSNYPCSGDNLTDIINYDKILGLMPCIPAVSLYLFMKCVLNPSYKGKKKVIIEQLGGSVFGVYLIEKITRRITSFVFDYAKPYTGGFLASILWVFTAVGLGFVIICSIRNLPYIGKYIRKWI